MLNKVKPVSDVTVVGIWLHEIYPDGFTGEGISRLLVWIVRATQRRSDIKLKVACVAWVKEPFKRHLIDLGVDVSRLEFITVSGLMPFLYWFYSKWDRRSKRKRIHRQGGMSFASLKRFVSGLLSVLMSWPIWIGLILILILVIVLSPLIVLGLFGSIAVYLLRWIQSKSRFLQKVFIKLNGIAMERLHVSNPADKETSPFAPAQPPKKISTRLKNVGKRIYHGLVHSEMESLARKASRDKKVHGWFLAYPRNAYTARLKTPVIQAVPDIVYMEFPTPFAAEIPDLLKTHDQLEETVRRAQSVITYSDFVKEQQVVKTGYQPAERVHVVRHAPISTRELISLDQNITPEKFQILVADIIREYLSSLQSSGRRIQYVKSLPFGDFDYLFVSSQTRPHKNHLNLIKVYERLLREKYLNIKLIFTGTFTKDMEEYIWKQKLHLDVLSIPHIPAKVHAAFYACAKMSIAPTLFEGGFPFVFSESLSVGRPSLLSDIPVVQELLTPEQRKIICFDPYDMNDMVDHIAWGLEHHQELLDYEMRVYSEMKKRTWDVVASEYIEVFKSTIAKPGK